MNKMRFTKMMAVLALLTFLIPVAGWGRTDVSFAPSDFTGQGASGTGSAISATVDGVTFECDKGYGTTQIRCYSGGTITISSVNTITSISFTFSGSYTGGMETSYSGLSTNSWIQTLTSQARITACTVSYTENGSGGGMTATLNIEEYADANNWANGTQYTTATVAPVTFTANGGGNTGKYYTSGEEWRYYQTENASITISVSEGYTITSVRPTYNVSNNGVLNNGDNSIASGSIVAVSGTSVTFSVGNSGSASNGQVKFTNIDVTYVSESGTQTNSDLTIANTSTALAFDLYNNTTEQVINYTTSSTGAITITPEQSNYFTYVHDISEKTITVTPTAVTPSAQTVTISQEADESYFAGTATFTVSVTNSAPVLDYATLPFTFYGGCADIAATSGLTYDGLGSDYASSPKLKFDNTGDWLILHFLEQPGNLSYDIRGNSFNGSTFKVQVSADGETYTDFVTYTNLPTTNEDPMHVSINNLAADVRYIKWVYAEKVGGNVALGNIELAVYEAPRPYTLSIENADTYILLAQGITNGHSTTVYGGTLVTVEVRLGDDYVLDEVVVLDTTNQQVTLTQVSDNKWSFYMPNSDVVISAIVVASHAPAYYNLATSIESGKKYIIVGKKNGVYYAMGAQKTNSNNVGTNRAAKPIIVEGNTASVTRSDVFDFTISRESDGTYSIYDVDAEGYLYVPSGNNNYIATESELEEKGKWTIAFDEETGAAHVVANSKKMQFNANSILFSCYASGSQDSIYLYKIDDTFTFDITGYTGAKDHYYLIASPVTVDPENVDGMTEGDFDLYYFDQTGGGESGDGKEWRNYKANHFNLVPGKGYLYAKKATDGHSTYSFSLTGDLYTGDGVINLEPGWNLIGNPFRQLTELDIEDYYVINETGQGSELIAGDVWQVQPMEGIFVYGDDDVSSVTFSRISSGSKSAGLTLNLSRGSSVESTHHGVIDRAIVRFGEGQQLPKFQLDENSTKVFISQDNKDYAVVRSAKEGEMPVCFKAEQNGTYTLSMNAKEMSFDYLHLVDNMTGMDIDLLQTPCYTFEAHTNDYTSRFRLIFSANDGDSEGNETFSYFNGSEWIINNNGDAVLEVVDITGRVVRSESINGDAAISINETAGVYMLRLINGDNVKTQKVVVR